MHEHPLTELIDLYLSEKDITKESYDLFNIILNQYVDYLNEHNIQYAKTSDINDYRIYKKNQGYSNHWIYDQINAIKGFYAFLSNHQARFGLPVEYAQNIAELVKNETLEKNLSQKILSVDQAKHLILHTKENRKYIWHYRDHAMIYLMLTTGMRSIEIRRARIKDIKKINDETILYVHGKGRSSKDAFVKISSGVSDAIEAYLKRRKDKNPYLFISHSKRYETPYLSRTFFLRMFRRVLNEVGLEHLKVTPHSLRHTAATVNLLRGGTLEETRRLMRHKELSTTLIYAHHIERMKADLENEIENYILNEKDMKNEDM
jgi:site-specific recombinase XerD